MKRNIYQSAHSYPKIALHALFADDFTISAHNKTIDQVASTLSNELQQVNKWCENNHMAINISKTEFMCVTSRPIHRQLSNTHSRPSVYFLDSVNDYLVLL